MYVDGNKVVRVDIHDKVTTLADYCSAIQCNVLCTQNVGVEYAVYGIQRCAIV